METTPYIMFVVLATLASSAMSMPDESPRMPNPLMNFAFENSATESSLSSSHWNMPEDHAIRRYLSKSPGKFLGKVTDEDVASLRQRLRQEDWNQFTPPPVTEVQCHVEFQVVKRIPGRCTKLGGHIPACQTEEYVEIDYNECS